MLKISVLRTALASALLVAIQGTLVLADTTGSVRSLADTTTTGPTTTKAAGVTSTQPTATANKTVGGNVYTVDAAAIRRAQGSAGGVETLFSQNVIASLVPGVVRFAIGSGPGYGGQGQLSMRGGTPDEIGYLIDGVPVNRDFDFYNGTSFNTNGVESLEVSTGGE